MPQITVLRPDQAAEPAASVAYASRRAVPEDAHLILIVNGKPRARDLMQFVADELQQRLSIATVEVFSKASAGKPIEGEEAREMAARAHLIITGVGD